MMTQQQRHKLHLGSNLFCICWWGFVASPRVEEALDHMFASTHTGNVGPAI